MEELMEGYGIIGHISNRKEELRWIDTYALYAVMSMIRK